MILVDSNKCIGCGQCVDDCVALNLEIIDKKAMVKGECLQCGHCVAICRSDAVSIPDYDMDDVEEISSDSSINSDALLSFIKARRSIRDYKDKKLSDEDIIIIYRSYK